MADHYTTGRRIELDPRARGWGVALFISFLGLIATPAFIYYVHHRTWREPSDPSYHQVFADSTAAVRQ